MQQPGVEGASRPAGGLNASDAASRAAAFQALLAAPGCLALPSAWDAGTARLLGGFGFPALETTSAGLAYGLGGPDGPGQVSRAETLANAALILGATTLPVFADLEDGFGAEPEQVAETVRSAAAIGLAGGSIEDATDDPARPLHAPEAAAERIAAAAEAVRRLGRPFALTARCEGLRHGLSLHAVITRLRRYAEAGADGVYAPGVTNLDQVRAICAAVQRPLTVLTGSLGATFGRQELEAAGARRMSLGSALVRSAYGGLLRAAREVREQGTCGFDRAAPSFAEVQAAMAGQA